MKYLLYPEVAGGIGDKTIFNREKHIQHEKINILNVDWLEYRFDGWIGDCLVCFLSEYLVLRDVAIELLKVNDGDFRIQEIGRMKSDVWQNMTPGTDLPDMVRITGMKEVVITSDKKVIFDKDFDIAFGICPDWKDSELEMPYGIVVSERFLGTLKMNNLDCCDVSELDHVRVIG